MPPDFEGAGIVYRDHKIGEFDDGDNAPTETVPLSIDHDTSEFEDNDIVDDDDADDDDDGFEDDGGDSDYNTLSKHHRQPAYLPHLFQSRPHLVVLSVLLLEFLALALTRAVLPSLLLKRYGSQTYIVMGVAECVRGILAFFACPLFGKLSDVWGRRPCLLITVMGTLAPVCSLAFWKIPTDTDEDVMMGSHADEMHRSMLGGPEGETIMLDGVEAGEALDGSLHSH